MGVGVLLEPWAPVSSGGVCVCRQARSSRALEEADDPMKKARDMHQNILGRIDHVQQQTGRILQGAALRAVVPSSLVWCRCG